MSNFYDKQKDKYSDYREVLTSEEAEVFQKSVYGAYCSEYKNNKRKMTGYDYRNSDLRFIIEGYLGNTFSYLNKYMRTGDSGCMSPRKLDILIDRLNELIICAPAIPYNLVVYRGVSPEVFDTIMKTVKEKDGIYRENAFLSTSLRLQTVLQEFPTHKCIMRIYVPKNACALGVDCIQNRSEEEILFPEGQYLRFIGKCLDSTGTELFEFELIDLYSSAP